MWVPSADSLCQCGRGGVCGKGGWVWAGRMLPLLERLLARVQHRGLHHVSITRLWMEYPWARLCCPHRGTGLPPCSPATVGVSLVGLRTLAVSLPQDLGTGRQSEHGTTSLSSTQPSYLISQRPSLHRFFVISLPAFYPHPYVHLHVHGPFPPPTRLYIPWQEISYFFIFCVFPNAWPWTWQRVGTQLMLIINSINNNSAYENPIL